MGETEVRTVPQLPDFNDAELVEVEAMYNAAGVLVVYSNVNGITVQRCVNPARIVFTDKDTGRVE